MMNYNKNNLLNDLILFEQHNIKLDIFDNYLESLTKLYDFLIVQNNDIFCSQKQTLIEFKKNENLENTLKTTMAIGKLPIKKETHFKLFKHILNQDNSNKNNQIVCYSMYCLWSSNIKFNKNEQLEIIKIIKDNNNNFYNDGYQMYVCMLTFNLVNQKYLANGLSGCDFKIFHQLNTENNIKLNDFSKSNFINYVFHQFQKYNLKNMINNERNDFTLKEALLPYFNQNIDDSKKELLISILSKIKHLLNLNQESLEFLSHLELNMKLSDNNHIKNGDKVKKI